MTMSSAEIIGIELWDSIKCKSCCGTEVCGIGIVFLPAVLNDNQHIIIQGPLIDICPVGSHV